MLQYKNSREFIECEITFHLYSQNSMYLINSKLHNLNENYSELFAAQNIFRYPQILCALYLMKCKC